MITEIFLLLFLTFGFVLPEENPLQNQEPQTQPQQTQSQSELGPTGSPPTPSPPRPSELPLPAPPSRQPTTTPSRQNYPYPPALTPINLSSYYPFNVTISHLSPRSIEISWNCKDRSLNDRYEVTIKPVHASYKVVEMVPNNFCSLLMDKLEPDTTYQISVSAFSGGTRRRSRYVVFRTFMEDDYIDNTEFSGYDGGVGAGDQFNYGDGGGGGGGVGGGGGFNEVFPADGISPLNNGQGRRRLPQLPGVRLVEISLVGMALALWAGAIVLFFHRWGKIRMLLPYQPDYKEMKNPANSACTTCSMTPHHQCQKLHLQNPTSMTTATSEFYTGAPQIMTTTMFHHHHPVTPRHHNHHYLPHQPMSEPGPGPSSSLNVTAMTFEGNRSHPGHPQPLNSNLVTVTEAGCSPIRHKILSFNEGDISIDMSHIASEDYENENNHQLKLKKLQLQLQRKSRSAEQLKQCANNPWEEESSKKTQKELGFTEF